MIVCAGVECPIEVRHTALVVSNILKLNFQDLTRINYLRSVQYQLFITLTKYEVQHGSWHCFK